MDLHKKFPDTICCHRAHKVIRNDDNTISKYSKMEKSLRKLWTDI